MQISASSVVVSHDDIVSQCELTSYIDLEVCPPVVLLWVLATMCLKGISAATPHQAVVGWFAVAVLIQTLHFHLKRVPETSLPFLGSCDAAIDGNLQAGIVHRTRPGE